MIRFTNKVLNIAPHKLSSKKLSDLTDAEVILLHFSNSHKTVKEYVHLWFAFQADGDFLIEFLKNYPDSKVKDMNYVVDSTLEFLIKKYNKYNVDDMKSQVNKARAKAIHLSHLKLINILDNNTLTPLGVLLRDFLKENDVRADQFLQNNLSQVLYPGAKPASFENVKDAMRNSPEGLHYDISDINIPIFAFIAFAQAYFIQQGKNLYINSNLINNLAKDSGEITIKAGGSVYESQISLRE